MKNVNKNFKHLNKKFSPKKGINTFQNERGGGLGTIFIGMAIILLAFLIFINIADYSLFTYKRNAISKAMDYAVTSAVQQINNSQSVAGVANGFSEDTGEQLLEGVEIDIDVATKTFLSIFYKNYNSNGINIDNNLLLCATSSLNHKLSYTMKTGTEMISEGSLENPVLIEKEINQAIDEHWPSSLGNSQIYINGNPKTNIIENGTYLFAYINELKITGLYYQRNVNLSSFAGAKLHRVLQK